MRRASYETRGARRGVAVLLCCCAAALRETLLRNLGGLPTV
jgi:hypothetical protein